MSLCRTALPSQIRVSRHHESIRCQGDSCTRAAIAGHIRRTIGISGTGTDCLRITANTVCIELLVVIIVVLCLNIWCYRWIWDRVSQEAFSRFKSVVCGTPTTDQVDSNHPPVRCLAILNVGSSIDRSSSRERFTWYTRYILFRVPLSSELFKTNRCVQRTSYGGTHSWTTVVCWGQRECCRVGMDIVEASFSRCRFPRG